MLPAAGRPPRQSAVGGRGGPAADELVDRRAASAVLPEARNAKYFARMFPGSQPAGMVKPARGERGAAGDAGLFLPRAAAGRLCPPAAAAGRAWTARPTGCAAASTRWADSFTWCSFPRWRRPGETIVLRLGRLRAGAAAGEGLARDRQGEPPRWW